MDFAVYTISIKGIFSRSYEIYKDDELVYWVKKPSFFSLRNLDFIDQMGHKVAHLYRNLFFLSYKFNISMEGREIATFEKNSIDNYFVSDGIYGYHTVHGDFFNSEYTVFNDDDIEIAKISRKRFRSNKKYGIAIIKGNDELYILAMVIAISVINARRRQKA